MDRLQGQTCFRHQVILTLLDGRVLQHIRLPGQRVLDRTAGHQAGFDDVVRGGGMVRLGVADDVHDVRAQGHLQVNGFRQVGAGAVHVDGVAE